MKKFKIILIAVVLLLVLVVILQNTDPVNTKFLFWSFPLPRALLLFLTFMFGFIAGLLAVIRFERKTEKKPETVAGREKS
ncbi:MAG: LapA family protein [Sedimentisphaerales bacterium]|nr:LapA family protein [Sedimentisphaerales bacterium]